MEIPVDQGQKKTMIHSVGMVLVLWSDIASTERSFRNLGNNMTSHVQRLCQKTHLAGLGRWLSMKHFLGKQGDCDPDPQRLHKCQGGLVDCL